MKQGREDDRRSRLARGSLMLSSGRHYDVLVQNVSAHGVGLKFAEKELEVGEAVRICLPNVGELDGTVRWQHNGRIGIQLAQEIDPERIYFRNTGDLQTKESHTHIVAEQFQPAPTTWRPGFGRRK